MRVFPIPDAYLQAFSLRVSTLLAGIGLPTILVSTKLSKNHISCSMKRIYNFYLSIKATERAIIIHSRELSATEYHLTNSGTYKRTYYIPHLGNTSSRSSRVCFQTVFLVIDQAMDTFLLVKMRVVESYTFTLQAGGPNLCRICSVSGNKRNQVLCFSRQRI